jgi:hypothetical protein
MEVSTLLHDDGQISSTKNDDGNLRLVALQSSEHLQVIIAWNKGLGFRHGVKQSLKQQVF